VLLELLERSAHAPAELRCRAMMWAGLLSIGRTSKRTWAMDAVDVARTAASAGGSMPSTSDAAAIGLTTDAIALARTTGDAALVLETLAIGSLHLAAIGSHPDILRALNADAAVLTDAVADPWYVALVTALDGLALYVAGELEESMTVLRSAISALRRLGDDRTAALFEISFSEVAELRGDMADATAAMATALDAGTGAGFRSTTILRAVLCWLCGRNGEVERALELGREVVALAHAPFNPVIRAQALFALGVAETLAGLPDDAGEHLGEALRIHERVGMTRETAMDHRHIGHLRLALGDIDGAIEHHRRGVELAVRVGLPWTVMLISRSLASAVVDRDAELACRLLGMTESLSTVFGYPPTADERELVETTLAVATERIGSAAVAAASASGAELSFADDLLGVVTEPSVTAARRDQPTSSSN
jgi:tetratricopeptide (TPR) repeat protein